MRICTSAGPGKGESWEEGFRVGVWGMYGCLEKAAEGDSASSSTLVLTSGHSSNRASVSPPAPTASKQPPSVTTVRNALYS